MAIRTPPTAERELGSALSDVGRSLGASLAGVIEAVPGGPHRPLPFARTLGVKKDLAHRVLRAIGTSDPIASLHLMPGPEGLRRFLDAIADHLGDTDAVARARDDVRQFEQIIQSVAGTRGRFDCLLTAWLPEARERVDLLSRQSIYRGMSGIRGVAAHTKLSTAILAPNADGEHVDLLWLIGAFGLRRLRPGVHVRFTTKHINAPTRLLTPDLWSDPDFAGFDPAAFLEPPIGHLLPEHHDHACHFLLEGDSIGDAASVNILTAELGRACMNRFETSPEAPRFRGPIAEANLPIEALVFDVLVHRDVYPGPEPRVLIYDTTSRGIASANDPTRDVDRLHHTEHFDDLSADLSRARLSTFPRYAELIEGTVRRLGHHVPQFRLYRCRIDFPVYGCAIHACFSAPRA